MQLSHGIMHHVVCFVCPSICLQFHLASKARVTMFFFVLSDSILHFAHLLYSFSFFLIVGCLSFLSQCRHQCLLQVFPSLEGALPSPYLRVVFCSKRTTITQFVVCFALVAYVALLWFIHFPFQNYSDFIVCATSGATPQPQPQVVMVLLVRYHFMYWMLLFCLFLHFAAHCFPPSFVLIPPASVV